MPQHKKRRIRQLIRQRLEQMDPMARYARSLAACKHLTHQEEFIRAEAIMIYLSTDHEVDTASIALAAWQMDKTVTVPKVAWDHKHMVPVAITSLETDVAPGRNGVRQPNGDQPVLLAEIDLIVVPGLAFDRHGLRIGRGGGFYDRFLAAEDCRAVICGLAFHEQVVDDISAEPHDRAVGMLVTDEEVLRFQR